MIYLQRCIKFTFVEEKNHFKHEFRNLIFINSLCLLTVIFLKQIVAAAPCFPGCGSRRSRSGAWK